MVQKADEKFMLFLSLFFLVLVFLQVLPKLSNNLLGAGMWSCLVSLFIIVMCILQNTNKSILLRIWNFSYLQVEWDAYLLYFNEKREILKTIVIKGKGTEERNKWKILKHSSVSVCISCRDLENNTIEV